MARITGTIVSLGIARSFIPVVFIYRSSPAVANGFGVDSSQDLTVQTNELGFFSQPLVMGDYEMVVNGRDRYLISVPDDLNTYDFTTRLIETVTQSPTVPLAVLGLWITPNQTTLATVSSSSSNRMAVLYQNSNPARQFYRWDAASMAVHDGDLVVRPNDLGSGSPGRWLWIDNGYGVFGLTRLTTAAQMKALTSTAAIQIVCLTNRESFDYSTFYNFVFGDTTTPVNGGLVIRADDGLGTYFALSM
jgi:hypothetical protein